MTNAELIAKIKAEIGKKIMDAPINAEGHQRVWAYNDVKDLLSTLEESEKPMQEGLEEEIIKCWQEWVCPSNKQSVDGVLPLSEFAFYARHFAQWGAEHFADASKTSPEDLEEAAEKYAYKGKPAGLKTVIEPIAEQVMRDFIAGAKWQAEQDQETIELAEDHAYFAGKEKFREQLLGWAKEQLALCDNSVAMRRAYDKLIDKLNSL